MEHQSFDKFETIIKNILLIYLIFNNLKTTPVTISLKLNF